MKLLPKQIWEYYLKGFDDAIKEIEKLWLNYGNNSTKFYKELKKLKGEDKDGRKSRLHL